MKVIVKGTFLVSFMMIMFVSALAVINMILQAVNKLGGVH